MSDFISSFVSDLMARADGPLNVRLLLQPTVALALAFRDGWKDAGAGRPAYGWSLLTDPGHRTFLIRDGLKSVAKVFVIAYLLDVTYQFLVYGGLRPLQGLVMAVLLALVPYVLLRGPASRLFRQFRSGGQSS